VTDPVVSVAARTIVLDLPETLHLGALTIAAREYATVELETESGLRGKAYCLTRNAPVTACVERLVRPHVLGADSTDIGAIRQRCIRANVTVARTGLVVRALGLVDVALWDVAAQRAGAPLHAVLGRRAEPVPVTMIAAYPLAGRPPEQLAADVLAYAGEYRLLKIGRSTSPPVMRRWLELVLDALPASTRLVVDAAYGWTDVEEALAETAGWPASELAWLEDPLVPEDVAGLVRLRRDSRHPIGIGDELAEKSTYERLLEAGVADVLRLDVVAIGGVSAGLEVLELASQAGVPVAFHVYPELSVHLATGLPGAIVEIFDPDVPGGNPLDPAHRLTSGRLELADGLALPPTAPGLGFELLDADATDASLAPRVRSGV
jgi:L-alanine-DL-glutamate epimerase-like enolase superfamily enzyme